MALPRARRRARTRLTVLPTALSRAPPRGMRGTSVPPLTEAGYGGPESAQVNMR